MRELNGKVAVITGAASGFGRELARLCAGEGMKVAMADVDAGGAETTGTLLNISRDDWFAHRCNVANAAEVDALADATYSRFGAVHLLFNNAGVMTLGSVWGAPLADWEWVFGVNVMGVVHGVRSFVPRMLRQQGEAHVVNTASLAGFVSPPGMGVYTASKHAVVALTECLYHDLKAAGASIGVSVLAPAFVDTGIAEAHRNRPPELAADNPEQAAMVEELRTAMKSGRLSAADIARSALGAVKENRFYVFPHRNAKRGIERQLEDVLGDRSPTNPYV